MNAYTIYKVDFNMHCRMCNSRACHMAGVKLCAFHINSPQNGVEPQKVSAFSKSPSSAS